MNPAAAPTRRRLNPFAFPSDTSLRFVLLILAVLGSALFVYNWLYFSVSDASHEARVSLGCSLEAGNPLAGVADASAYAQRAHRFNTCLAQVTHPKGFWILGGVGAMLLLALVIYLLTPTWQRRRRRLVPLLEEDVPEVVAELARLSQQAGLSRTPRFLWNPLDRSSTGLAFGRAGKYEVAFGGGLVMTYYTDPDVFRAVALHELAHIRDRDVDRTYFTMALWYAFLLAGVLPLLPTLADEGAATIARVLWRLLALVALVYVVRNAVLRARESHADLRADVSGGAPGIRRVLAGLRARRQGPLRLHPSPSARLAVLDDTDQLFGPGIWEALTAGVVLTLVYHELVTLIGFYVTDPLTSAWLAALAVAPVVGAVVSIGLWRAAFAAAVRGVAFRAAAVVGVALAAGTLAGEVLSLNAAVSPSGAGGRGIVSSDVFGWGVAWPLTIAVVMVLLAYWTAAAATTWWGRTGGTSVRSPMLLGIAACSVALTVWTGAFFLAYDVSLPAAHVEGPEMAASAQAVGAASGMPHALYRVLAEPQVDYLESRAPVLPTLALFWVFPLAALLWRTRRRGVDDGAFLDPGDTPALTRRPSGVREALLCGVLAGAVGVVSMFALRAGVHAGVSSGRRSDPSFTEGFYYWMIAIALVVQALAAAATALRAPTQRIVNGLSAAFLSGVITSGAILLGPTVGSCIAPLSLSSAVSCPFFVTGSFVWLVARQVLCGGAVVAFVGAALVCGVRGMPRLRRHADEPSVVSV